MGKIREEFKRLKAEKKKAFIPYLTFGYPDVKTFARLVVELDKAGSDFIEIGLPFSDPIADGPIIQESSHIALEKGANIYGLFRVLKQLKPKVKAPFILMSYVNPIYRMGIKKFFNYAKECIQGIIVSDLLVDQAGLFVKEALKNNIDTVFFISPVTQSERIGIVDKNSSGFIYYISVTGVTGPRDILSEGMFAQIKMIREKTSSPICVGFGISTQEQARRIKRHSDGVIVGSAIIKKISETANKKDFLKQFRDYVAWLNG